MRVVQCLVQLQRLWNMTGETGLTTTRESCSPSLSPYGYCLSPPLPLSLWGELFNTMTAGGWGRKVHWGRFLKLIADNWTIDHFFPNIATQIYTDRPATVERPPPASCESELRQHGWSLRPTRPILTVDLCEHAYKLPVSLEIKSVELCQHLSWFGISFTQRHRCVCVCVCVSVCLFVCLGGVVT